MIGKIIEMLRYPEGYAEEDRYDMADWLESQEPVAFLDLDKVSNGMAYATSFRLNDKQVELYAAPVCDLKALAEECFNAGAGYCIEVMTSTYHKQEVEKRDLDAIITKHTKVGA